MFLPSLGPWWGAAGLWHLKCILNASESSAARAFVWRLFKFIHYLQKTFDHSVQKKAGLYCAVIHFRVNQSSWFVTASTKLFGGIKHICRHLLQSLVINAGNDNRRKVGQELLGMETKTPVVLFIFRPILNKLPIPRCFPSSLGERSGKIEAQN